MLTTIAPDEVNILSGLETRNRATTYLDKAASPDIIFANVSMDDGLCFEVLSKCHVMAPVIFTAEDEFFVKRSLDYNCIAYLLMPPDAQLLRKALDKYRMLQYYFTTAPHASNIDSHKHARHRILVKHGKSSIALPLHEIVFFHTEHRCVYVTDQYGHEYTVDKTLSEMEAELDKDNFFRVNRQYIVNINFIYGFKPYDRVKLLLELTVPELKHSVLVSQEMAPQFREWISNA